MRLILIISPADPVFPCTPLPGKCANSILFKICSIRYLIFGVLSSKLKNVHRSSCISKYLWKHHFKMRTFGDAFLVHTHMVKVASLKLSFLGSTLISHWVSQDTFDYFILNYNHPAWRCPWDTCEYARSIFSGRQTPRGAYVITNVLY